jgi:hypothetical protein
VASIFSAGSARGQFAEVLDIPPKPNIGDLASISSGTQLNLRPGGSIGKSFDVGHPDAASINLELNVLGGLVGNELATYSGSVTNIVAGAVGDQMAAFNGSMVNIAGGIVGLGLDANAGSMVNISGGIVNEGMEASGATVNVTGGTVGGNFRVFSDSLVNVSGGRVGFHFYIGAIDGSSTNVRANLSGGVLDGNVQVTGPDTIFTSTGGLIGNGKPSGIAFNAFSLGHIRGGVVDANFDTRTDSDVRLYGSDFRLDDLPIAAGGQKITIPLGSVLTGILADGTPFMLSDRLDDQTAPDTLSLHASTPPPVVAGTIMVPGGMAPASIRGNQTLIVSEDGVVDWNFRAGRGSTVTIAGGQVGNYLEAVGATINVSGGTLGGDLAAYDQCVVNISGGSVGDFNQFDNGTIVNISGGSVGSFQVGSGSRVNISGGSIGSVGARNTSEVNISGGAFADIGSVTGSSVKFFGGDFRLNGVPVAGLDTIGSTKSVNLAYDPQNPTGKVLSGTLADGTPFVIDRIDGTLTLEAAVLPPVGSSMITVPASPAPLGIRQGQTLVLSQGGLVGDTSGFTAGPGSTLLMTGGEIRVGFKAIGATANISDGHVQGLRALTGSEVSISGSSTVVFDPQAYHGSELNISGGNINSALAHDGSVVNISGGTFVATISTRRALGAEAGSELNITGGDFQARVGASGLPTSKAVVNIHGGSFTVFQGNNNSVINLFGTEFQLGGVEIPGLDMDQPFTITDRNVTLTGILADGSPFSFDLNPTSVFNMDYMTPGALLTVTRVAPITMAGDYDNNGTVDAADYLVWRNTLGQSGSSLAADGNRNGAVDTGDYNLWRANFGRTFASAAAADALNTPVPEPSTLGILSIAVGLAITSGRARGWLAASASRRT